MKSAYNARPPALLLAAQVLLLPTRGMIQSEDWLVGRAPTASSLNLEDDGSLLLSNGLIHRRFVTTPNWATVSLQSASVEFIRGLAPEARLNLRCMRHQRNSSRRLLPYAPDALAGLTDQNESGSSPGSAGQAVGGLRGQRRYAFLNLNAWNLTAGRDDWVYVSHEVTQISARWAWTPGQRHSVAAPWPPRGLELRVHFKPPARCGCGCGVRLDVVYEIYDGVPTLSKRVEAWALPSAIEPVVVETLVTEELHVAEEAKRRTHVETDFMPRKTFWAFAQVPASDPGNGSYAGKRMNYPTWWLDPDYEADLHDETLHADNAFTALLLQVQYPLGPWQPLHPGARPFGFFRVFLTLFDSDDFERQSLSRRRILRTLFPQVTETPLYFYSTNATSAGIRRVADQAAAVGFEGIILSYGSGFDPSSSDHQYIERVRQDTLYCRSRGLLLGGYTLMQNPPGLEGNDYCKSPDGATTYNTHIADFSTAFHAAYRKRIFKFLERTTMQLLETDGPYEGATCAVTNHSGFAHQNNSQVAQYQATVDFYLELKARFNTFNTVPDPYWSSGGTNKEPMGYTDQWNRGVPRTPNGTREYLELGRMYLFDGTVHKPTTMGWLAFELYRTPAPMHHHLHTLEEAAASYLGQGNVACYRGSELYDDASPGVARMWKLWVAHYKAFRRILSSETVHVRRPSGSAISTTLHVNASAAPGEPCAFANLFNPTDRVLTTTLDLPVYYAGLAPGATVRLSWGGSLVNPTQWPVPQPSTETVRQDYTVRLAQLEMQPRSFLWAALQRHGSDVALGDAVRKQDHDCSEASKMPVPQPA